MALTAVNIAMKVVTLMEIMMENYQEVANVFKIIGKSIADAAVCVSGHAVKTVKKVDPDVGRHLAQVPLLGYCLFVPHSENFEEDKEADGYPPVVFVHGLGGNRGNFKLMSWFFALQGRTRSYAIHFDSGKKMGDCAEDLALFIEEVVKTTGEEQVDIVAHSMGGLITRLAMLDDKVQSRIRSYVSLGTPHKGSYPARYANTETIRALRPGSELLKKLEERPWPANIRGACFYSANDVLVVPGENAKLEGCVNIDASPFTHYSYLIDPAGWRMTYDQLMVGFDKMQMMQTIEN